ncbi:hypothetical protein ACFW3Z_24910 [Nocardiopsis alba]|uniref:hypothetical protein n=1 Tax=Nocardiopsis alba TaxID=53437 RepID=UPI00366B0DBD
MSLPSAVRRRVPLLTRRVVAAFVARLLVADAPALIDVAASAPTWMWVVILILLGLVLLGVLALAVLRACWPSQSLHRKQLLEALLRRSAP